MTAIIAALLPTLLKLIEMYLDSVKSNKEAHEAFLNFISKMQNLSNSSLKLHDSYEAQKKRIEEKLKVLDGNS